MSTNRESVPPHDMPSHANSSPTCVSKRDSWHVDLKIISKADPVVHFERGILGSDVPNWVP